MEYFSYTHKQQHNKQSMRVSQHPLSPTGNAAVCFELQRDPSCRSETICARLVFAPSPNSENHRTTERRSEQRDAETLTTKRGEVTRCCAVSPRGLRWNKVGKERHVHGRNYRKKEGRGQGKAGSIPKFSPSLRVGARLLASVYALEQARLCYIWVRMCLRLVALKITVAF